MLGSRRAGRSNIDQDIEVLGISSEAAEKLRSVQKPKSKDFVVHPDNWDTAQLFLRCVTQWRRAGMDGSHLGFDYAAVEATARIVGIDLDADRLTELQVMEGSALQAWSDKRARSE